MGTRGLPGHVGRGTGQALFADCLAAIALSVWQNDIETENETEKDGDKMKEKEGEGGKSNENVLEKRKEKLKGER